MQINKAYISRFEQRQASKPLQNIFDSRVLSAVKQLADSSTSQTRVLEVGCGTGYWFKELENQLECRLFSELQLEGLDISSELIDFATDWSTALPNVAFRCQKLDELLPDELYDFVFLIEVYQHFPRAERFPMLLELLRHVRKGGQLCIVDKELFTPFGIKMTLQKKLRLTPASWRSAKYPSFQFIKKKLRTHGYVNSSIYSEKQFSAITIHV